MTSQTSNFHIICQQSRYTLTQKEEHVNNTFCLTSMCYLHQYYFPYFQCIMKFLKTLIMCYLALGWNWCRVKWTPTENKQAKCFYGNSAKVHCWRTPKVDRDGSANSGNRQDWWQIAVKCAGCAKWNIFWICSIKVQTLAGRVKKERKIKWPVLDAHFYSFFVIIFWL